MRSNQRIRLSIAVPVVLCLASVSPIAAQSEALLALGTGAAISKLGDELRAVVESAREAGRSVTMEAAMQTNYTLQNFAAVYADQRNRTVRQLDAAARRNLGEIERLTTDLRSGAQIQADELTSRLQTITNTLPFRDKQPQVSSTSPRFIAPRPLDIPVSVVIRGNFEFAARPGFTPRLRLNNTDHTPTGNTTQELRFQLPASQVRDVDPANPPQAFGFTTAELTVPWERKKFFGLLRERRADSYRLMLGLLPEVPGQVTVTRIVPHATTAEAGYVRGDFGQRSDKHGGNDDHTQDYALQPDPGCQHVPGSAQFEPTSQGGDWSRELISESSAGAIWRVFTRHKTFGASGRVDFRLRGTQRCPRTDMETLTTTWNAASQADLRWGEQKSLPLPDGTTYTVVFTAFDGRRFEASSPGDLGGLVRLTAGNGLQVIAANPATLTWP